MKSRTLSVKSAAPFVFILPSSAGVRPVRFRVIGFLAVIAGRSGVTFAAFRQDVTNTAS